MNQKKLAHIMEVARPLFERELGMSETAAVALRATAMVTELGKTAPRFRHLLNRINFSYAISGLALYRALREAGDLEEERAIELLMRITDLRIRADLDRSRVMRFLLRNVGRSRILAEVTERAMLHLSEPHGWLARLPMDRDGAHIALDVHHCGLMRYLTEQGAPELGPVFCSGDDTLAEYMPGLHFDRPGTIASGAPVCTFRYHRE